MSDTPRWRFAEVRGGDMRRVAAYLPSNYAVLMEDSTDEAVVISGIDAAGWTLDDYVIPRLASGLMSATEFTP